MKKAIALLATLVVLTSAAFAQFVPTISASAETKWGVNLDKDNATGFENSADITVNIPLAIEGAENVTDTSSITVTGVEVKFKVDDTEDWEEDSVSDGDIAVKILLGEAYVVLGNSEGTAFNFADSSSDYYDIHANIKGHAGFTVGYSTDMFNLEANVNSDLGYDPSDGDDNEQTWGESDIFMEVKEKTDNDELDVNTDNRYNWGVKGGITPSDLFSLDFGFSLKNEFKTTNAGAKAYGTISEGLTYEVPFDYLLEDGDDKTAMELYPNVEYKANGITLGAGFYMINVGKGFAGEPDFEESADLAYFTDDDGKLVNGASLTEFSEYDTYQATTLADDFEAKIIKANVGYGTDTFNVNVAADIQLHYGIVDAKDADEQKFTLTADVTPVAGAKLYFEAYRKMEAEKTELVKVGAELTSALTGIENTIFTIQFEGFVEDAKDDDNDNKGIFYVGAKISL